MRRKQISNYCPRCGGELVQDTDEPRDCVMCGYRDYASWQTTDPDAIFSLQSIAMRLHDRGVKKKKIAAGLGITMATYGQLERGTYRPPLPEPMPHINDDSFRWYESEKERAGVTA